MEFQTIDFTPYSVYPDVSPPSTASSYTSSTQFSYHPYDQLGSVPTTPTIHSAHNSFGSLGEDWPVEGFSEQWNNENIHSMLNAASQQQPHLLPQCDSTAATLTYETSPEMHSADKKKKSSKVSTYKHIPHCEKPVHLVARRNARERKRVQAVNHAFVKLRKVVPVENRKKRLSKVKTLQCAIEYIAQLEEILADQEGEDVVERGREDSVSSSTSTLPSSHVAFLQSSLASFH